MQVTVPCLVDDGQTVQADVGGPPKKIGIMGPTFKGHSESLFCNVILAIKKKLE